MIDEREVRHNGPEEGKEQRKRNLPRATRLIRFERSPTALPSTGPEASTERLISCFGRCFERTAPRRLRHRAPTSTLGRRRSSIKVPYDSVFSFTSLRDSPRGARSQRLSQFRTIFARAAPPRPRDASDVIAAIGPFSDRGEFTACGRDHVTAAYFLFFPVAPRESASRGKRRPERYDDTILRRHRSDGDVVFRARDVVRVGCARRRERARGGPRHPGRIVVGNCPAA